MVLNGIVERMTFQVNVVFVSIGWGARLSEEMEYKKMMTFEGVLTSHKMLSIIVRRTANASSIMKLDKPSHAAALQFPAVCMSTRQIEPLMRYDSLAYGFGSQHHDQSSVRRNCVTISTSAA